MESADNVQQLALAVADPSGPVSTHTERSFTPPLNLQQQLASIRRELDELKQQQVCYSSRVNFTWENIPDYSPEEELMSLNRWLRLVDEKAYFSRWDEVTTYRFIIDKLSGRAREWYLNRDKTFNNLNELKSALQNTFDVDSQSTGKLFKDAALCRSSTFPSFVDYYSGKLEKLHKLNWHIPVKDKINIIVDGLDSVEVNQLATANNYTQLEDLLTYLRSCDRNYGGKRRVEGESERSKIRCFNCNDKGHKSAQCPKRRNNSQNSSYSSTSKIVCSFCHKIGHYERDCRKKLKVKPKAVNIISNRWVNLYFKTVIINNVTFEGLVDTGSECSLIRFSAVEKLNINVKNSEPQNCNLHISSARAATDPKPTSNSSSNTICM